MLSAPYSNTSIVCPCTVSALQLLLPITRAIRDNAAQIRGGARVAHGGTSGKVSKDAYPGWSKAASDRIVRAWPTELQEQGKLKYCLPDSQQALQSMVMELCPEDWRNWWPTFRCKCCDTSHMFACVACSLKPYTGLNYAVHVKGFTTTCEQVMLLWVSFTLLISSLHFGMCSQVHTNACMAKLLPVGPLDSHSHLLWTKHPRSHCTLLHLSWLSLWSPWRQSSAQTMRSCHLQLMLSLMPPLA